MQGPTLFSAPLALNEPVTCDTDVRQTRHTAANVSVCAWSTVAHIQQAAPARSLVSAEPRRPQAARATLTVQASSCARQHRRACWR
jgi:hypothetical protein